MNKVWLITGSASGLGRSIAEAVLDNGDRLVATALDPKRLDDLVNLPASRLTALLLVAAAGLTPGASAAASFRAMRRDAHRHRSPNAGYPEAAMAGALGLALAGPRSYGGIVIDDALMGDGRRDATAADIRAALSLYRRADAMLITLVALLAAFVIATA